MFATLINSIYVPAWQPRIYILFFCSSHDRNFSHALADQGGGIADYMEKFCWEDSVREDVLRNGYLLYKRGHIRNPRQSKNVYSFRTNSYYPIETMIEYNEPGKFSYSCTCWEYKRKREMCEHIVGALYRIEEPEQDRTVSKKMIIPFHRNVLDNDYLFFDMCSITDNVIVYEELFNKAQKMIEDGTITAREFELKNATGFYDNKNEKQINCVCEFGGEDRKYSVHFGFSSKAVKYFSCTAPRCYFDYSGAGNSKDVIVPCEHCIGAMLLAKEYVAKNNPGDITDDKALHLMKLFRKRSGDSGEKRANIVLEPELSNDDGELLLGFKIGEGKLYKVRNLTTLVETVKAGGVMPLGKTASIDFSLSTFDDRSLWYYDFIQTKVKDNVQRNARLEMRNRWGYYMRPAVENITGSINLEGSGIEEVYEYFKANNVRIPYVRKVYGTNAGKGVLTCRDGIPEIKLTIKEIKDGRNTAGITVAGHVPEFCQGSVSAYFSDDKYLYRIPDEEYRKLWPIFELAGTDGDINLTIGRRNLGEFYHSVLPALKEVAVIEDNAAGKIESILPPRAEITFFLDTVEGIPECRIKAVYNEKEHSALDAIDAEMYSETYRDFFHENEAAELAQEFFPSCDRENEALYCTDEDLIFKIYREGLDAFLSIGDVQCTDRFRSKRVRSVSGIKVGVSIESDLLNLDISSGDITREELIDVLLSYRMKKKYHRLTNGDFIDLEDEGLAAVASLLDSGNVSPKELLGEKISIPMYRALYVDKLLEKNEELYGHRDRNFRKLIKDFGTVRDSDMEVPVSLENTLRGYQVYGYKWLRTLEQNGFGGILADEMGLGKTLQMITVLKAVAEERAKAAAVRATSLIVCPASLVYNWKEEFLRFAPELKVETVAGGIKDRRAQIVGYKDADILITSYDLMKRDIAEYEECAFDFCILDEAQYIKNPKTAASKTVKAIKAARHFALTGTPIENRLSELWSIFDFLMPGFLYEYETFRQTLESPIAKDKDEAASEKLRRMVHPFILRRLKSDVLKDLPDKIEEIHYAIMEKEQQKLYDAQVLKISNKLKEESDEQFRSSKIEILAELTRTRQLCCDPGLVYENYAGESAKRIAAVELIESAIEGEHRMLVFSQFTSMLDLLAADLKERNIPFFILTGDTGKEERVKLMKDFNEGDVPVFLISLKAGGTGLNLTGADIVIHYDPWWNIAVQNQATDRAHRIGQTKKVTVYKLIIKGTIEEKIVKLQESKKDLADGILSGEMGGIGSLLREDLLELL